MKLKSLAKLKNELVGLASAWSLLMALVLVSLQVHAAPWLYNEVVPFSPRLPDCASRLECVMPILGPIWWHSGLPNSANCPTFICNSFEESITFDPGLVGFCRADFVTTSSGPSNAPVPGEAANSIPSKLLGQNAYQNAYAWFNFYGRGGPGGSCGGSSTFSYLNVSWERTVRCPVGFFGDGWGCWKLPVDCCVLVGNPIDIINGRKRQIEVDAAESGKFGQIGFKRIYSSDGFRRRELISTNDVMPLGGYWRHSFQTEVMASSVLPEAVVVDMDGNSIRFLRNGNSWAAPSHRPENLVELLAQGQRRGWIYSSGSVLIEYDELGRLREIFRTDGTRTTAKYTDGTASGESGGVYVDTGAPLKVGLLRSVEAFSGRSIIFDYYSNGLLSKANFYGESSAIYGYSGVRLQSVKYSDGSQREYGYKSDSITTLDYNLLIDVYDEAQRKFASFSYDSQGRSVSTEHAGGVEKFTTSYNAENSLTGYQATFEYADALNNNHAATVSLVNGTFRLTSEQRPCSTPGCSGVETSTKEYDALGQLSAETDFRGVRSCYNFDSVSRREIRRVEGLGSGTSCSQYYSPTSSLPADTRRTTTEWHSDWRLKVRQAEPGKVTTWVYNGRPDSFNGGAIANCASEAPTLPNGKSIPVLCKKIEQNTGDANGSQGFGALVVGGARVWTWEYDANGQALTETGPNGELTSYSYYAAPATADHMPGDLQQVTRKVSSTLSQTTQYLKYTKGGQVLQSKDDNNVVTDYAYDERQRLKSVTVGGQATAYEYWSTGLLKQVTQPDASYVAYEYDDAHRLTAVKDGQGNRIEYELDNAGVRKKEVVKGPGNSNLRQIIRSIDALGRVQQTTGGE